MNQHQREFLKKKKDRHNKRVLSFKDGKSKGKQRWNYLVSRGMLDRHLRQRG